MQLIPGSSFLTSILAAFTALGLLLLFWHSTIRRNAYFSVPLLLALLGLNAGVLLIILHWAGGSQLLISSGLLLLLTYSWWFWRKTPKTRLDYLKLLWIAGLGLSVLLLGSGQRSILPYVSGATTLGFWAMLLEFIYVTYLKRRSK
ncbi:hypothetical protein [Hymenobacter wooponensis]|uniref:Uncharacterized protein n=1 Tax=Hymenobacter wooponensis TaxID=1525360 RepID=A0A4Z0MSK9_9BACT|nr:hypothetical protein [Hymenobacter wooponensis]TGD82318.1 hypothetical protein EU557_00575 [Hymenobacter wooponensis]